MTCKPYDNKTNASGFCFASLLNRLLGTRYDDPCMSCFAAAGIVVDNAIRPIEFKYPP